MQQSTISPMDAEEYDRLASLGETHWWHSALHHLLMSELATHFRNSKNVRMLDLGCGAGTFLAKLGRDGYEILRGIDAASAAISHCAKLGLPVQQADFTNFDWAQPASLDALFCLDSSYFFRGKQLEEFFQRAAHAIEPGGALFIHAPALKAFAGKHDQLVGIEARVSLSELRGMLDTRYWKIERLEYRYFLLSPLIFIARKLGSMRDYRAHSSLLNAMLRGICVLEDIALRHWRPWGSSVYLRARRTSTPVN